MKLTENQIEWCINHTMDEATIELGIGTATAYRVAKKYGFKFKRKEYNNESRAKQPKECKHCGKLHLKNGYYCSRECSRLCPIRRKKLSTMDKSYMQTEAYKETLRCEHTPAFKLYSGRVHRATEKVYKKNIDMINPDNHPRTICGVEGGYQLDHIIPIIYGFRNNIDIEDMARLENLRMLTWKENLERNWKEK
jgi:hypothetical protein